MSKKPYTTEVTGHLIQYSWSDKLLFTHVIDPESGHEVYHRPITITVPLKTLAFNPADKDALKDAARMREIEALVHKKGRLQRQIEETEEEIQSLLALPSEITL